MAVMVRSSLRFVSPSDLKMLEPEKDDEAPIPQTLFRGPLVTGNASAITVWDSTSLAPLHRWPMPQRLSSETFACLSPDGARLAITLHSDAPGGVEIRILDLATGHASRRLRPASRPNGIRFSADGRTLYAVDAAGWLYFFEIESETLLGREFAHSGIGWAVKPAVSSDGRILATGGNDAEVKIWDASQRSLLRTLAGHHAAVLALAISPDSRTLATGGEDGMIKLWNPQLGQELLTLNWPERAEPGDAAISTLAFSPDGTTLVAITRDGHLRRWRAP
jgi:WD40 repeat protein